MNLRKMNSSTTTELPEECDSVTVDDGLITPLKISTIFLLFGTLFCVAVGIHTRLNNTLAHIHLCGMVAVIGVGAVQLGLVMVDPPDRICDAATCGILSLLAWSFGFLASLAILVEGIHNILPVLRTEYTRGMERKTFLIALAVSLLTFIIILTTMLGAFSANYHRFCVFTCQWPADGVVIAIFFVLPGCFEIFAVISIIVSKVLNRDACRYHTSSFLSALSIELRTASTIMRHLLYCNAGIPSLGLIHVCTDLLYVSALVVQFCQTSLRVRLYLYSLSASLCNCGDFETRHLLTEIPHDDLEIDEIRMINEPVDLDALREETPMKIQNDVKDDLADGEEKEAEKQNEGKATEYVEQPEPPMEHEQPTVSPPVETAPENPDSKIPPKPSLFPATPRPQPKVYTEESARSDLNALVCRSFKDRLRQAQANAKPKPSITETLESLVGRSLGGDAGEVTMGEIFVALQAKNEGKGRL